MPDGVLEIEDKSGMATVSKATAETLRLKAGQTIFLVNHLPYGPALEYGWSKQAPAGMVRITVEEFGGVVNSSADEAKRELP